MHRSIISSLLPIAFLFVGAAYADPSLVANDGPPEKGIRTVHLEEVWTIGGDEEGLIFGNVNGVELDDEGNAYLLDGQLSVIRVVSPEGFLLCSLGGEGEGPGEFRAPADLALLGDGSVGALQSVPGRIVRVSVDSGDPLDIWPLSEEISGALQMERIRQANGQVVVGGVHQSVDGAAGRLVRRSFLAAVDPQTGLLGHEFLHRESSLNLASIRLDENDLAGGPEGRFTLMQDGRLAVAAERNGYEISVYGPDGALQMVFSREYESWQRDARALGIWERILETVGNRLDPQAPRSWEPTEPDVQAIGTAPDGRIWIQNAHGRWAPPAGVFTCFDVFTADGVYDEEVRYVCDGDARTDALFHAGGERVFRVSGYWDAYLARFGGDGASIGADREPQPVSVTCYRIR